MSSADCAPSPAVSRHDSSDYEMRRVGTVGDHLVLWGGFLEAAKRAFEAMMKIKKIDIAAIEAARRGTARA